MTAYRDDLEAAQMRAADLERELTDMRVRNKALEKRLEGVRDTEDALSNARRLEVALEREQHELRQRTQAEIDDRAEALLRDREQQSHVSNARSRRRAASVAVAYTGLAAVLVAVRIQEIALAALAIIVFAAIIVRINCAGRDASTDGAPGG